jgi:hypothetical protein
LSRRGQQPGKRRRWRGRAAAAGLHPAGAVPASQAGGTVTAGDYWQLGGVAGRLARQADKVAAELANGNDHHLVLQTLLRFVTLDETGPTRRGVRRSTLSNAEREVVEAFVAARLLTSDAAGDDVVVEVTREALFRQSGYR